MTGWGVLADSKLFLVIRHSFLSLSTDTCARLSLSGRCFSKSFCLGRAEDEEKRGGDKEILLKKKWTKCMYTPHAFGRVDLKSLFFVSTLALFILQQLVLASSFVSFLWRFFSSCSSVSVQLLASVHFSSYSSISVCLSLSLSCIYCPLIFLGEESVCRSVASRVSFFLSHHFFSFMEKVFLSCLPFFLVLSVFSLLPGVPLV